MGIMDELIKTAMIDLETKIDPKFEELKGILKKIQSDQDEIKHMLSR